MATAPQVNAQTEIARLYDCREWETSTLVGKGEGHRFIFKQVEWQDWVKIKDWLNEKKIELVLNVFSERSGDSSFTGGFYCLFLSPEQFQLFLNPSDQMAVR